MSKSIIARTQTRNAAQALDGPEPEPVELTRLEARALLDYRCPRCGGRSGRHGRRCKADQSERETARRKLVEALSEHSA